MGQKPTVGLFRVAALTALATLSFSTTALATDDVVVDGTLSKVQLEQVMSSGDWQQALQAEALLGQRAAPALYAAIAQAVPVRSRDGSVRFVDEVFSDTQAVPAILHRLLTGQDSSLTRQALAIVFASVGDAYSDVMLGLLQTEADPAVRSTLVYCLRRVRSTDVATEGLRIALSDPSAEVRAQAARTTPWRVDGVQLASELIVALQDSDDQTRAMAARALGWLKIAKGIGPLLAKLDDSSADVRLHALRSLSRIGPDVVSDQRLAVMLRDTDSRVVRVARRFR